MAITWKKDIDAALNQAKAENKPALLDFIAALQSQYGDNVWTKKASVSAT